jgi:polysaccharide deacetylase 2 family uncharacterized protein YibQ
MSASKIMGWCLAGLMGGFVAIVGQHVLLAEDEHTDPAPVAQDETAEEHPRALLPTDPMPARSLVLSVLEKAGINETMVTHGRYPLLGAGRSAGETLPLLSFTCPVTHPCSRLFDAIEARGQTAGMELVGHDGGDKPGRALFRALAREGHPALAIRAFPPGPRLSLVMGGVGREPALLDAMLALDPDVTYAVMANSPYATEVSDRLAKNGREVIAHLPLEPSPPNYVDGPEFLTTAMPPGQARQRASKLLAKIPGAVGADAYLGSRFVTSKSHVSALMGALREAGIFYLDRRITTESVTDKAAKSLGVRTVLRTHYLDGEDGGLAAALRAIEVSLVLQGHAVVVASPSPEVLAELGPWLRGLRARRIHLLRLSEVVL